MKVLTDSSQIQNQSQNLIHQAGQTHFGGPDTPCPLSRDHFERSFGRTKPPQRLEHESEADYDWRCADIRSRQTSVLQTRSVELRQIFSDEKRPYVIKQLAQNLNSERVNAIRSGNFEKYDSILRGIAGGGIQLTRNPPPIESLQDDLWRATACGRVNIVERVLKEKLPEEAIVESVEEDIRQRENNKALHKGERPILDRLLQTTAMQKVSNISSYLDFATRKGDSYAFSSLLTMLKRKKYFDKSFKHTLDFKHMLECLRDDAVYYKNKNIVALIDNFRSSMKQKLRKQKKASARATKNSQITRPLRKRPTIR